MNEMRILTVRQPWAWAIFHGGKDVENRTRNLAGDYRGPVAIHVAQSEELNAFSTAPSRDALNTAADRWYERFDPHGRLVPPWRQGLGHIIGVVDLTDVHVGPEYGGGCHKLSSPLPVTPTYDLCSPWGEAGTYHLVLANPQPLPNPIPYRGALGLRRLDPETITHITAALAAGRNEP